MTIKKNLLIAQIIVAIVFLIMPFSCQKDEINVSDSDEETDVSDATVSNSVKGIVRIKLTSDAVDELSVSLKSGTLKTNVNPIDSVIDAIGATSFKRTFPYCGKFEERTKKAGLDLWYDVQYDTTNTELTTALKKFSSLSEVNVTESVKKIHNEQVAFKPCDLASMGSILKSTSTTDYPVNDTLVQYQWNYNNDGSMTGSVEGCDIGLFDAWQTQTGSEDVIVAVVDGGIEYDHPDLADNMWVNSSESSDNSDDDDNGYADDIYGYNFVDNSGTIVAHGHGTHVAGTIGAVNNNETGVCGIAGGDDTHVGVRLMSCQVFEDDEMGNETSAENFAEAIKYAADNGAVICQNSWGYDNATSMEESMKEAIDYFIEYAGYDESGTQTGPMAGGVVIFAAGNDSTNTNAWPAMYDPVIAVASCSSDYTLSSFSDYGSWIDITAPGGGYTWNSKQDNQYILSTYTDDGYAFAIGTSMACPHVSGVAALVVSQFGGTGFTPDDLKEKLYQGAIDLDEYNSDYEGMTGAGLINAAAALKDADINVAPNAVTELSATASNDTITLSWTVPSDEDDTTPYGYTIYYSTSDFSETDITSGSSSISSFNVKNVSNDVGDQIDYDMTAGFSTTYYFKIAAYDVINTYSDYSETVSATTGENESPNTITDLAATASSNTITLTWSVPSDDNNTVPSGYVLYYSTDEFSSKDIESGSSSLTSVEISAGDEKYGDEMSYELDLDFSTTYYFRIAAYDSYSAYSDYSSLASATTEDNQAPEFTSDEGNSFTLKSSESTSFTVSITDPDGDDYTWSYSDEAGGSSATEVTGGVTITIDALEVDDNNTYTATLTATDENDASSTYTITYSVDANNAPTATIATDSIYIGDMDASQSLNLEDYFEDADGEDLNYALDYTSSIISASVSDQTLTISPKTKGLTTLTVTASDARDAEATSTITLMIRDDSEEIDIYPNPVSSTVHFRMGEDVDGTINVKIYNSNGVLKNTKDLSISAFSPASTDISDLNSGQYLLKITYNNEEIERNIVKL